MPKHSKGDPSGRTSDHRQAAKGNVSATPEAYRFGPFALRTDRRELRCDDVVRPMERRCFDLLVYLLRHAGRVVTKDELLEHVWANRFVTLSVIAQCVLKVRKALRLPDGGEGPLRTVHRVGYRLVGEVVHRRLAPADLKAQAGGQVWHWAAPDVSNMPDAPDWLSPALGAFGAWALHNHGIAVEEGPVTAGSPPIPQARCLVAPGPMGFEACVDLHLEPAQAVRLRASSTSPFQAVWQAAESAAWLARLRELVTATNGERAELRWERLAALSHVPAPVLGKAEPLLSAVWRAQLDMSTLEQQSDLVMEAAWRGDPAASELANQLRCAAAQAGDAMAEAWAELSLAMIEWYQSRAEQVHGRVHRCMGLVKRAKGGVHVVRAAAIAAYLLNASGATPDQAEGWRQLQAPDTAPGSTAWRWRLLADVQHRLYGGDGADPAGAQRLDAWVQASSLFDGLQALLLNQCGLLREEDGDLDQAWQRLKRATDVAAHSAWKSVKPLCVLSLGELSARLGDRATFDDCIAMLEACSDRDSRRTAAVRDWMVARRLRMDAQYHAALGLLEQAVPVLQGCGRWFREDAWLMAIDTAMHVRSRGALTRWRQLLAMPGSPRVRARSATLAVMDAAIAQLDGERSRACQLVVQAWRGAPPSTAKRLLAMAAASALRWTPTESADLIVQALDQAGAWLHQSPPGRRLRDAASYRVRSSAAQGVAEPDLDTVWLWAA